MLRCLELALMGSGQVAPNPMVGAVLVYEDVIIGEGYHQVYGQAHAEVNCIHSVLPHHQDLISRSTLYVSLEPCAHFGKTPPCADLIIRNNIPRVVVGCRDPFPAVSGKGIEKMQAAGVEVMCGILEELCIKLNRRFLNFHNQHRPWILLKWAQSSNLKIALEDKSRVRISNDYTNRLVHKWRSEEASILVGTNTALYDDPDLTTRLWPGADPLRLVVDKEMRLPALLKLFNKKQSTIVFNTRKHSLPESNTDVRYLKDHDVHYYRVTDDVPLVDQVVHALYQMNIQSVLVEGGTQLIQSFIDKGLWDEARVITNQHLVIERGLPAPVLSGQQLDKDETVFSDIIHTFTRIHQKRTYS